MPESVYKHEVERVRDRGKHPVGSSYMRYFPSAERMKDFLSKMTGDYVVNQIHEKYARYVDKGSYSVDEAVKNVDNYVMKSVLVREIARRAKDRFGESMTPREYFTRIKKDSEEEKIREEKRKKR